MTYYVFICVILVLIIHKTRQKINWKGFILNIKKGTKYER
jgi:hypothetical protein